MIRQTGGTHNSGNLDFRQMLEHPIIVRKYFFTQYIILSLSETLSVATVKRPTDWIGVENGADESFA